VSTEADEKAAWDEYLRTTRGLSSTNYEEVEAWAWAKLTKQLLTIFKRKPKKVA